MLSRVLDPRDGRPRDPVFWLVLSAIVATQLLAFWSVCMHQVREAQERRYHAVVEGRLDLRCAPDKRSARAECPTLEERTSGARASSTSVVLR